MVLRKTRLKFDILIKIKINKNVKTIFFSNLYRVIHSRAIQWTFSRHSSIKGLVAICC